MNDIDAKLQDRYQRAYAIIGDIPVGDKIVPLIIEVANQIKEEEEKIRRATDKSDIGGILDKEEQEKREKEAKLEKAEEEAWGELDLGLPEQANKKEKVKEE